MSSHGGCALAGSLDERGGVSANNVPLQVYTCSAGAPNQTWDYYFY